jgi:hypothetical protein
VNGFPDIRIPLDTVPPVVYLSRTVNGTRFLSLRMVMPMCMAPIAEREKRVAAA